MVRVCLVMLFLACVNAAPVPDKAKVALVRDSAIGIALAAGGSNTFGIFEGNRDKGDVENQEGGRRPDFSILEKVSFGAALALDKSVSVGVIKNNLFGGKNPFEGWGK